MQQTTNLPKVSVILSTFNRCEHFLPRAIESVINQSFKDWELIIIDDCSTDNTQEVVGKYASKDERIKYLRLPKNSGSDTKPKNVGIFASKGEFIAYLDDDCEFLPYHLDILIKRFEKVPDLDVAYCDMWLFNEEKLEDEGSQGIAFNFDAQFLLNRNYIDTSEVMHKRDLAFAVGGFDETLPKFIDWNMWVRMMKWGAKFQRVPVIATNYYLHQNTKSKKVKTESWFDQELGMTMFKPTFSPSGCPIYLPYLGNDREAEKNPKVAGFMLTYDRLEYTMRMLKSLDQSTSYPIDLFIVDNGSKDETKEWFIKFKNILEQRQETVGRTQKETSESLGLQKTYNPEIKRGSQRESQATPYSRDPSENQHSIDGEKIIGRTSKEVEQNTQKESSKVLVRETTGSSNKTKNKTNKDNEGDYSQRTGSLELEGGQVYTYAGVYLDKVPNSSIFWEKGLRSGASVSNGETFGQVSQSQGSSTPHQPRQEGQQDREFDAFRVPLKAHGIRNVALIFNKENKGISIASNEVLDCIKDTGEYQIILKVDNDCEFMTKRWLESVVDLWKRNHLLYMSPYPEGLVHNPGGGPRIGNSMIGPYFVEVAFHIGGLCAAIDARAYKNFRWTDKFLHGNQDREASLAFTKMGYMPCYIPMHRISHMDTTEGQHQKYPDYFERRKKEKQTQYEAT